MSDQPAERLPDEAAEAAARVLHADYTTEYEQPPWDQLYTHELERWLSLARRVLDAAAPLLIEAGKRAALDGLREEWGVDSPEGIETRPEWTQDDARGWAAGDADEEIRPLPVIYRHVTAWQAVAAGDPPP